MNIKKSNLFKLLLEGHSNKHSHLKATQLRIAKFAKFRIWIQFGVRQYCLTFGNDQRAFQYISLLMTGIANLWQLTLLKLCHSLPNKTHSTITNVISFCAVNIAREIYHKTWIHEDKRQRNSGVMHKSDNGINSGHTMNTTSQK